MTAAPAWMWTRTADVLFGYWLCQVCGASGDGPHDLYHRAAAHVIVTGHPVTITRARTVTLEGVATDAIESHV